MSCGVLWGCCLCLSKQNTHDRVWTHRGFRYLTCQIPLRGLRCISKIVAWKISVFTHWSRPQICTFHWSLVGEKLLLSFSVVIPPYRTPTWTWVTLFTLEHEPRSSKGDLYNATTLFLPPQDMGTVILGKLESGSICKAQQLVMMPNRVRYSISFFFDHLEP